MSNTAAQFFDHWHTDAEAMKREAPAVTRAFGSFFQSLMGPGALTVREKELIALAIAIADRCAPCMFLHVEKCLKSGATREQILEAAGVAVVMQGGPAYTHVPEIVAALEHLEARKQS